MAATVESAGFSQPSKRIPDYDGRKQKAITVWVSEEEFVAITKAAEGLFRMSRNAIRKQIARRKGTEKGMGKK